MINIKQLASDTEFGEFIKPTETLNVVKVSAEWCGPCRVLGETIKNLDPEKIKGVLFAEINAETFENVCETFGVKNIPVLLFFNGPKLLEKAVGLLTADALYKKIEELKVHVVG